MHGSRSTEIRQKRVNQTPQVKIYFVLYFALSIKCIGFLTGPNHKLAALQQTADTYL